MKTNTITNRYIIREMLGPFSINMLVFTFLFLMSQMIEITDWIINYSLNISYSYSWQFSDKFGFIRRSELRNFPVSKYR